MYNFVPMGVLPYPNVGTSLIPPFTFVEAVANYFGVRLCTAAARAKGVAQKTAFKAPDPAETYLTQDFAYIHDEELPVSPCQGNYRTNILCGAAIVAGEEVESNAIGRAIPYAQGVKLGKVIWGATVGQVAYIELYNLEED